MEKNKKNDLLRKIILILLIAAISLVPSIISKNVSLADSGFGMSYDSGSSSSSSYGGSDYSSSDYSSGNYSGESDGISTMIGFIIVVVVIICIIYSNRKSTNQTNNNVNDSAVENKIKQYILDFNKAEFIQKGYKIYCDVQNAWMNFKLDDVKDIITDEIYNMYDSQLTTLEVKGEQNIMKDIKLRKGYLKDVINQNGNITIVTGYEIELYDYIIEQSTGKVLRGSEHNKLIVTYEMRFRKTLDENAKVENCPNCGAKVEMNGSGTCPYCGSKIVSENIEWVLTEKKTINQQQM